MKVKYYLSGLQHIVRYIVRCANDPGLHAVFCTHRSRRRSTFYEVTFWMKYASSPVPL
jgi:hypothetical protein